MVTGAPRIHKSRATRTGSREQRTRCSLIPSDSDMENYIPFEFSRAKRELPEPLCSGNILNFGASTVLIASGLNSFFQVQRQLRCSAQPFQCPPSPSLPPALQSGYSAACKGGSGTSGCQEGCERPPPWPLRGKRGRIRIQEWCEVRCRRETRDETGREQPLGGARPQASLTLSEGAGGQLADASDPPAEGWTGRTRRGNPGPGQCPPHGRA